MLWWSLYCWFFACAFTFAALQASFHVSSTPLLVNSSLALFVVLWKPISELGFDTFTPGSYSYSDFSFWSGLPHNL